MNDTLKHIVDYISAGTAIAALLQAIPAIAGILTIIWAWYRIKEMRLAVKVRELEIKKLQEN